MRIGDRKTIKATSTFVIPREDGDIEIQIQAIGPKLDLEISSRLTNPQPPSKLVMKNGKPVKDERGRPVKDTDESDPAYLEQLTAQTARRMAVACYFGTVRGGDVEFETAEALWTTDAKKFADGLISELEDVGFGSRELMAYAQAVYELSGITDDDVDGAKATFRDGEGGADG